MEKDLSEGCYIIWKEYEWKIVYETIWCYYFYWFTFDCEDIIWNMVSIKKSEIDNIKILWHYDITAVLKYVRSTKNEIQLDVLRSDRFTIWTIMKIGISQTNLYISLLNKKIFPY